MGSSSTHIKQQTNNSNQNKITNISNSKLKDSRVLLIAISYPKTSSPLTGTLQDKTLVEETLRNKGATNIVTLTDKDVDPASPNFPTKENILRSLRWLLSSAPIEDFNNVNINTFPPINDNQLVFFYYSGHGSQVKDYNGDEIDGNDEVICPVTISGGWDPENIKDETLLELINKNSNQSTIFLSVLDCCHSGTGLDLPYRIQNGRVYKYDNTPNTKCNIVLISGSQDYQYSYEGGVGGGKVHGYLTWAWCKAVNYRNGQSLLSIQRLIDNQVASLIRSNKQMPNYSLGKSLPVSYVYPI